MHKVLHADDPPRSLALGIAIGVFIAFTPTIGIQMMIIPFIAWIFGANKLIGLPVVWISNPVTIVPIYLPSYWLGAKILRIETVHWSFWAELRHPPPGWVEAMNFYGDHLLEIIRPITVGCAIVAPIAGIASYFLSLWLIRWYRLKRFGQLVPPDAGEPSHSLLETLHIHEHNTSKDETPTCEQDGATTDEEACDMAHDGPTDGPPTDAPRGERHTEPTIPPVRERVP